MRGPSDRRRRGGPRRAQRGALLALAVALSGCTSSSSTPGDTRPPDAAAPGSVATQLGTLEVRPDGADETAEPYRRDAFGDDWDYDPASGCSTRERVLIAEAIEPPTVDDRCRSVGGRWRSLYDGVEHTDVASLQIDHLVPLADAWRSGAASWSDERRFAFANDLDADDTLIAVTGSTNQSKSDATPDRWLPPARDAWCPYIEAWVRTKVRWQLSVTPAERQAALDVLETC